MTGDRHVRSLWEPGGEIPPGHPAPPSVPLPGGMATISVRRKAVWRSVSWARSRRSSRPRASAYRSCAARRERRAIALRGRRRGVGASGVSHACRPRSMPCRAWPRGSIWMTLLSPSAYLVACEWQLSCGLSLFVRFGQCRRLGPRPYLSRLPGG